MVETARAELRRRRLLTFLRDDEPAWKDENHPEFVSGTAAWVKGLRRESETISSPEKNFAELIR